jgi:hypothetical protein
MLKDLLFKKFYSLTVISARCGTSKEGKALYLCRCDCGKEKILPVSRVARGTIKSCGCIRYRKGKANPKFTGYEDITGEFWRNINTNARRRNVEVKVTLPEIWLLYLKQNRKCALSGKPIKFGNRYVETTASLDRIDSKKAYTSDNIQWLHKDVNFMKQEFPENIFIDYCLSITRTFKEKSNVRGASFQ